MISKFSEIHTFYYQDIQHIHYFEEKVNWKKVKTYTLFGFEHYGGKDFYAKPGQLMIVKKNKEDFIFLKFGKEISFVKTIELIKKQICV